MSVVWIDSDGHSPVQQLACHLTGYAVDCVAGLAEVAEALERMGDGVIYIKLPLRGMILDDLIILVRRLKPSTPVLVHDLTERAEHTLGRHWGAGIFCIIGPSPLAKIANMLHTLAITQASAQLGAMGKHLVKEKEAGPEPWRENLIGDSPAMRDVVEKIRLIAPRKSTILLTGETGTGKEVVARAIHKASDRAGRSMVAVNCGALPEALLEAELFGHSKGAFTGAVTARVGRFEQAHQGTIFLDEIGDLPLDLQSKLLRVLQEREFQRLGSSELIRVDVRVIAATNVDLLKAVNQRRFREDLYYRLNVVGIHLPALRHRRGDISLLLRHFIDKLCRKEGLPVKTFTARLVEHLEGYPWPGNVRQFEHATERAIILSDERSVLEPTDYPLPRSESAEPEQTAGASYPEFPEDGLDFNAMVSRIERYLLAQALEKCNGNKSRAAEILKLKRSTLVSKVKALEADGAAFADEETALDVQD